MRHSIPTTPSDNRAEANDLATAKRKVRFAHSVGQEFGDYLCRHHKVGPAEELRIELVMMREAEAFISSGAGGLEKAPRTGEQVLTAAGRAERIEIVKKGARSHPSTWLIRGRRWVPAEVVAPVELEPVQEHQQPAPTTPVIVQQNGHIPSGAVSLSADQSALLDRLLHAGAASLTGERDELLAVTITQALEDHQAMVEAHQELLVIMQRLQGHLAEAQAYMAGPVLV